MPTAQSVKNQLLADLAAANAATGKGDATVHAAVNSLIAGFGQGSGVNEPEWVLIEDRTVESETSSLSFSIPDCHELLIIYSTATARDGAFTFRANNQAKYVSNVGWKSAGAQKGFTYISDFIANFPLIADYSPISGINANVSTIDAEAEIPEFPPAGMASGTFSILTDAEATMPIFRLRIDGYGFKAGSRFAVYGRRKADEATEADYIAALNELGVEV